MLNSRFDSLYEHSSSSLESNNDGKNLLTAFWITASVVVTYFFYLSLDQDASLIKILGASPVMVAALVPVYIWCARTIRGVPMFPLFALTYLWTYAIPLVSRHPVILTYDDVDVFVAGLTTAGFLAVGTLTWYFLATSPLPRIQAERILSDNQGRPFFFVMIASAGLFTMSVVGQWFEIESSVFSIIRSMLFALSTVGLFAFSHIWGKGELSPNEKLLFVGAIVFFVATQLSTLFLVSAIIATGIIIVGYTSGRRRFSITWVLVAAIFFGFLHSGKGPMREQYWGENSRPVQIWQYPAFFLEWVGYGFDEITTLKADDGAQAIYERVSLAHLLLKAQNDMPESVPYLHGTTYAIIPGLLVPRIFDENKLTAHEGTKILNVHLGIQTREATESTTIGWGLLNEAYANYGTFGVLGLGLLLGAMYGWITNKTVGAPVLALRSLVAMTFAALAIQSEFTAGVYFSALFQSLVSVWAVGIVLMDRQPRQDLKMSET